MGFGLGLGLGSGLGLGLRLGLGLGLGSGLGLGLGLGLGFVVDEGVLREHVLLGDDDEHVALDVVEHRGNRVA